MSRTRLIARLDVKGPKLVKGIHLEGLKFIGDPQEFARKYYQHGIDEIIYLDAVASLYGRESLLEVVRHTAKSVFIPITVGGGIRSVDDATEVLRAGADKVSINTGAVKNPKLITEIAKRYGTQCAVLSVDVRKIEKGKWEVFIENGRERTGIDALEWICQGVKHGAGELLLTSIDQEGTRKGFDLELIKTVTALIDIPVIASGGMNTTEDLIKVVQQSGADAVAMADVLHHNRLSLAEIRANSIKAGLNVRPFFESKSEP